VGVAEVRASWTGERFLSNSPAMSVRVSAKGWVSMISPEKMRFVFSAFCDIENK
jgi:hypothetical protein